MSEESSIMDSVLDKLNSRRSTFKKPKELVVGQKYKIREMRHLQTKFGQSVLVEVENSDAPIILPRRYNDLDIKSMNNSFTTEQYYLQTENMINNTVPIIFSKE